MYSGYSSTTGYMSGMDKQELASGEERTVSNRTLRPGEFRVV